MITAILLCLLLGVGFGSSYLLAYSDYKDYGEINIPCISIAIACLVLIVATIWYYCNHPEMDYDRIRCTEYHVTQKISDKGDTTYIIKYKPSL